MKARHGGCCAALIMAVIFQANDTLLAQDVAAAARANRANQNKATAKADNEWYSPTRASIRVEGPGATIFYEISGNQDPKITMDTVEKGKR